MVNDLMINDVFVIPLLIIKKSESHLMTFGF
jgi:hypothetical protein